VVGLTVFAAVQLLGCAGEDASQTESQAPAPGLPSTSPAPLPGPGGGPGGDIRTEYAALQQRLNGLQQQAMQDSVLQAEYATLETIVEAHMAAADPKLAERRDRMVQLQQEMGAAQQAGEEEKMQGLLEEGTALQEMLRQVQQETMAREDVQEKMTAFRDHVLEKMTEIDPEASKLVDRANEIGEQLSAAGPPAPGGAAPGGPAGE
jgi:hypothetical protein